MPILNTGTVNDLTRQLISDIVLQLLSYVAAEERQHIRQRVIEGLAAARARGARFGRPCLERSEEFYRLATMHQLGANHLLSEAKALILSGIFLRDSKIYNYGKELLINEAIEQFLPDGGHFERSVSYHMESLQQYFESYAYIGQIGDDTHELVKCMRKAYRFLNCMISANGKIPLFNDAAYDYPFMDATDFLSTARYVFSAEPPCGKKGLYYKRWCWLDKGREQIEWNIHTAIDYLKCIQIDKSLQYGIDFCNNYCSGNVLFEGVEDSRLILNCADIYLKVLFSFKSLIVKLPKPEDKITSPLIFEAADDYDILSKVPDDEKELQKDGVEACLFLDEGRMTYSIREIAEMKEKEDSDINYVRPNIERRFYFVKKGIIAASNVKPLEYGSFHKFFDRVRDKDGHDLMP